MTIDTCGPCKSSRTGCCPRIWSCPLGQACRAALAAVRWPMKTPARLGGHTGGVAHSLPADVPFAGWTPDTEAHRRTFARTSPLSSTPSPKDLLGHSIPPSEKRLVHLIIARDAMWIFCGGRRLPTSRSATVGIAHILSKPTVQCSVRVACRAARSYNHSIRHFLRPWRRVEYRVSNRDCAACSSEPYFAGAAPPERQQ